jgi:hypothetical protein
VIRTIRSWLVAGTLFVASGVAQAGLITNGGFETGDLTGWSVSGDGSVFVPDFDPHSGVYFFMGLDNDDFSTLSQSFATTSGQTYDFSFWSRTTLEFVHPGNILRYQFDSGPIVTVTTTPSWSNTTTSFVAGGPLTTLKFLFETDPQSGTWLIDDVDVVAAVSQPAAAVPLPPSAWMGLAMLGGLGVAARLRRRRPALA